MKLKITHQTEEIIGTILGTALIAWMIYTVGFVGFLRGMRDWFLMIVGNSVFLWLVNLLVHLLLKASLPSVVQFNELAG